MKQRNVVLFWYIPPGSEHPFGESFGILWQECDDPETVWRVLRWLIHRRRGRFSIQFREKIPGYFSGVTRRKALELVIEEVEHNAKAAGSKAHIIPVGTDAGHSPRILADLRTEQAWRDRIPERAGEVARGTGKFLSRWGRRGLTRLGFRKNGLLWDWRR